MVHQTLKIPWPISPREIVLEREFRYLPPRDQDPDSSNQSPDTVEVDSNGNRVPKESEPLLDVEGGGVVIVRYHSIEDDRIPMHPGRVRAESPLTMWRFQDVTLRERGRLHCNLLSFK